MNIVKRFHGRFFALGIRALKKTYECQPQLMLWIIFFIVFGPIFAFAIAKISAYIVNVIQLGAGSGSSRTFIKVLWLYGAVMVVSGIFALTSNALQGMWRNKVRIVLDELIIAKRYGLDIGTINSPEFQLLIRRIREAPYSWTVLPEVSTMYFKMVGQSVSAAMAFYIVAAYNWHLAAVLLAFIIPEFVVNRHIARIQWQMIADRAEVSRFHDEARSCYFSITSLIEAKLFGIAPFLSGIIDEFNEGFFSKRKKIERRKILLGCLVEALSIFGLVYCMNEVVKSTVAHAIPIGQMTLLFYGLSNMRSSSNGFLGQLNAQQEQNRYLQDVFSYFDLQSMLVESPNAVRVKYNEPPTIEFQHVWFKYPQQEGWALQDISLTIRPGDKIALFGRNGSGKSTMMALLSRFYHPTQGKILVNGTDLAEINAEDWRQVLSVLLQRHNEFDFTLRQVVGLGDISKTPTDDELARSLEFANASQVVLKMPGGYDTQLGEAMGGVSLSGGERKRVAIAMRMFRDAHLLILDEPERELDSESRSLLFRQLRELSRATTAIYASHNLATLRLAERILIFSEGRFVCEGSHDYLLAQGDNPYADAFEREKAELLEKLATLRVAKARA